MCWEKLRKLAFNGKNLKNKGVFENELLKPFLNWFEYVLGFKSRTYWQPVDPIISAKTTLYYRKSAPSVEV